jgi:serine/threonine-protein kinase RsbW
MMIMILQHNFSHFTTFCDTKNLKLIRDFVSSKLSENQISTSTIDMIVLAVDEICSNAIIHSNLSNPNLFLDVSLTFKSPELMVEVKDKGNFFSLDNYQEQSIMDLILLKRKGNMGLMLVKKIMDKIEYERENEFNICRMYKKVA